MHLGIRNNAGQLELTWLASSGRKYSVMKSVDGKTWTDFAGPYDGEDDTTFILPITKSGIKWLFKLIVSVPQDYSVPAYTITDFGGAFVILNWENLGLSVNPGSTYVITRDGQQIKEAAHTESSFKDTNVQGGKTYLYDVRFHA